jgi:hypothetical protein
VCHGCETANKDRANVGSIGKSIQVLEPIEALSSYVQQQ